MIKILFLTFIFTPVCFGLDMIDFEKLFYKKQYRQVSLYGEKYPSKFSNRKGVSILSKSNYQIKNFANASATCAKGAIEFEMKLCYKMLKKIKSISSKDYYFGLASYYMEIGDFKKSFEKFYELLKLEPSNLKIRAKLTNMLYQGRKYSYAWEQLQYFSQVPNSLSKTNSRMQALKQRYSNMFSRSTRDPNDVPISALYYYLMFNPTNDQEKIQTLRSRIQKFSVYGNSEEESLWLANLLYIEGKYKDSQKLLKEIKSRLISPQSQLSGDALQAKLSKKLTIKVVEVVKRAPRKSNKLTRVPSTKASSLKGVTNDFRRSLDGLDLRPLDDSELPLASTANLQVLKDFHEAFQRRNKMEMSDYEERWLFRELDDAEDLLLEKEGTEEALKAYLASEDGKVLKTEYVALQAKILERDQENAVMFDGELKRFNNRYDTQKTDKAKKMVLASFVKKWEKTALAKDSNLVSQGALNAYRKTQEGKQLAKRIYEIALELKLRPPNLDIGDDFLSERDWD
ncbi:MAG: hypothetical protein KC646_03245 [Candidatus Cloacimonetes bacterium]|nr:hypothetical protein [Candidatus Cloacimonadota bacterium]